LNQENAVRQQELEKLADLPAPFPASALTLRGNPKRVEQDGENGKDKRKIGRISSIVPILPILLPTS
jgi:hypothetical protein